MTLAWWHTNQTPLQIKILSLKNQLERGSEKRKRRRRGRNPRITIKRSNPPAASIHNKSTATQRRRSTLSPSRIQPTKVSYCALKGQAIKMIFMTHPLLRWHSFNVQQCNPGPEILDVIMEFLSRRNSFRLITHKSFQSCWKEESI